MDVNANADAYAGTDVDNGGIAIVIMHWRTEARKIEKSILTYFAIMSRQIQGFIFKHTCELKW